VREFLEIAVVVVFAMTVTGLLIAGVVRYAVEEPVRRGLEDLPDLGPADDHASARNMRVNQNTILPWHMPGEPAESRS
jgi:hypothetical protein